MLFSEKNVLNQETFDVLQDLIGPELNEVLLRHLAVASAYINTIDKSLKTSDFQAINAASHPLGSSSRQIGAFQVAEIAEEIEAISKSSEPNLNSLSNLILKLKEKQSMVDDYIKSLVAGS